MSRKILTSLEAKAAEWMEIIKSNDLESDAAKFAAEQAHRCFAAVSYLESRMER